MNRGRGELAGFGVSFYFQNLETNREPRFDQMPIMRARDWCGESWGVCVSVNRGKGGLRLEKMFKFSPMEVSRQGEGALGGFGAEIGGE